MQARIDHPVKILPGAMQAMQALSKLPDQCGLPQKLRDMIHLRASQINGCSVCVDMHWRGLKQHGETDERAFAVAAWHDAPYFTDAERAALALTEAVTRLSDKSDPVPDEVCGTKQRGTSTRKSSPPWFWISESSICGTG